MIPPHSNLQRLLDDLVRIWKPLTVVCLVVCFFGFVIVAVVNRPQASLTAPDAKSPENPTPLAPVQKPQAPVVIEHAQPKPTPVQPSLVALGETGSKPVESAKPETVPVPQAQLPAAAPAKASVENFTPPAPVQKPQGQAVADAAPPQPMPPVSSPSPVPPPAAVVVATAKSETPGVPQPPKAEWAEYTAHLRSVISEGVLRKEEADVLAALSLECSSVTQSLKGKPGDELVVVLARFRLASNPKQPGKKGWSQTYSSAASFNPKTFQGIKSSETIERVIQDLKENLLEDKETLTKLQQAVSP